MRYPFLLTSDQHAHGWSQFSSVNSAGINTRLAAILGEMIFAHKALYEAGGNLSVGAGDLFHVRGRIEPSVFNPTFETIKLLHKEYPSLKSLYVPGNHDLEGKDATALGNAMQQLGEIKHFQVATHPHVHGNVIVVPWVQDLNHLRAGLKELLATPNSKDMDLVIHAPVNGVIRGIPDHGLEARELADLGFKRVFAGHYHDHKELIPGKVWSIGATSMQTWNDPGTLAGFCLVYEDRVVHVESSAPKFVDLLGIDIADETELAMVVSGNYVRLKIEDASEAEVIEAKKEIMAAGALGAIVIPVKTKGREVSRTATTVSASTTLEASVAEFVTNKLKPTNEKEVQALCASFIAKAREIAS